MMLRVFAVTSAIVILMGLLLGGARTTGSAATADTAANRFIAEQCSPQPCWRSIQPGKTPIDQTRNTLKADSSNPLSDYKLCWSGVADPANCWHLSVSSNNPPDGPADVLLFDVPQDALHLGDVMAIYGPPMSSQLCYISTPTNGDVDDNVPRPLMIAYLTFKGGIKVTAYSPHSLLNSRIEPRMSVARLKLQSTSDINNPAWHGFSEQKKLGCNMG
ncbi:MAG TPA: hypothetical protein VKQ72_15600 [Aggregatilineales bacterium]|nr:hypothetical protein [Aggregatilineales bacterium]